MHTTAMATKNNAGDLVYALDGNGVHSGYVWHSIRALAAISKGSENADSLAYYGLGKS